MSKKLCKSNNKVLSGVCGGIGEYFNVDPTIIRVLWAILTFFTAFFGGIILYFICAAIMPQNPNYPSEDNTQGYN